MILKNNDLNTFLDNEILLKCIYQKVLFLYDFSVPIDIINFTENHIKYKCILNKQLFTNCSSIIELTNKIKNENFKCIIIMGRDINFIKKISQDNDKICIYYFPTTYNILESAHFKNNIFICFNDTILSQIIGLNNSSSYHTISHILVNIYENKFDSILSGKVELFNHFCKMENDFLNKINNSLITSNNDDIIEIFQLYYNENKNLELSTIYNLNNIEEYYTLVIFIGDFIEKQFNGELSITDIAKHCNSFDKFSKEYTIFIDYFYNLLQNKNIYKVLTEYHKSLYQSILNLISCLEALKKDYQYYNIDSVLDKKDILINLNLAHIKQIYNHQPTLLGICKLYNGFPY